MHGLRWDYRGPSGAIGGHRRPCMTQAGFYCLVLYIHAKYFNALLNFGKNQIKLQNGKWKKKTQVKF